MRISERALRVLMGIGIAIGVSLSAVPAASAATATLSGTTVTYTAAPGEANQLVVTQAGGNVVLDETGSVTISDGGGCPIAAGNAQCPQGGVTSIVVNLDDRNDQLIANSPALLIAVTADGGAGTDQLIGSAQGDALNGGGDQDSISGGAGDDIISGGAGTDGLNGEAGNDTLNADSGSGSLSGGDGNDTLNGGPDGDGLTGGEGNDTLNGNGGDDAFGYDGGADAINGGAGGGDRVDWYTASSDISVTLDGAANDGAAGEGDNVGADVETVTTGYGNDTIVGSAARNSLSGGSGNDTVSGGDGPDTVSGSDGDDTVNGDGGSDSVSGGSGNDTVNGGADGDFLSAGDGSDVLNGGDGYDYFEVGCCSTPDGGDTFNGGAGVDTASFEYYETPVTASLDGVANDGITGAPVNIQPDIENLVGGEAADTLTGGAGTNTIEGGAGNDTITIRDTGGDTATCGTGADVVIADGLDSIDPVGAGCEAVDRGAVPGLGRVIGRAGGASYKKGVMTVTLSCPLDVLGGCSGTATFSASGLGTIARATVLVPAASLQTIRVTLSKKAQSAIKKKKKLKVTLKTAGIDLRGPLRPGTSTFTVKR